AASSWRQPRLLVLFEVLGVAIALVCRRWRGPVPRMRKARLPIAASALLRVRKLRNKIGAEPSLLAPPHKPPHWRRDYWARTVAELAVLEAAIAARLHATVAAVRRRRPKDDRHSNRAT